MKRELMRGRGAPFPNLDIFFLEKMDDSDVVLERYDVGLGETLERGHIVLRRTQRAQDVLG